MGEFVLGVLLFTAGHLLLLALLASPVLLWARRPVRAWLSRLRWRPAALLAAVAVPLTAYVAWRQVYAPFFAYDAVVAQYWMQRAAQAPTREERESLVRRVFDSDYGPHIALGAIRRGVADREARCELYRIAAATPQPRGATGFGEAIGQECRE